MYRKDDWLMGNRQRKCWLRGAAWAACVLFGLGPFLGLPDARAGSWPYDFVQVTDNDVQEGPPQDINVYGHIVWIEQQAPGSNFCDIWLYADGQLTRITNTPTLMEWTPRINDAGQIAYGQNDNYVQPSYFSEVWLYTPGSGHERISPPDEEPIDSHWQPDINNAAEVVWHFSDSFSAPTEVYLYSGGSGGVATNITNNGPSPDENNPRINDSGWIVWRQQAGLGPWEVYLWIGGTATGIDDPEFVDYPPLINSLGHVVWSGSPLAGGYPEVFLWIAGHRTRLTDDALADGDVSIADNGAIAWLKSIESMGAGNREVWAYFPGVGVMPITQTPEVEFGARINSRNEIVYGRAVGASSLDNELFVWANGRERRITFNGVEDSAPIINDAGVIAFRRDDLNDFEIWQALPHVKGDMNADRVVDMLDVPLFVDVLLGVTLGEEMIARADVNDSETADGLDIQLFVDALLAP